ncbi:RB1-inducible coiled-coil protein 1 isoform X2 [Cylas formicarius]|uniref:RB1-inducible coiled-coil protein 1 isoform X2 n=1 Tax=Cylas formicarius TaxID=197179 RepID=UPI002958C4BD|nr:RB1-inducible coiled-coil protein 1 isoform X2 [Cylas formicarius]XP_060518722.1 RB1-inducible coiled-coil protein 1 isoform X2 [Cylas formicarius]XP_060518723.1 RB1-inducible coiled-coil protein 1 isoform X2 [Cylas formicarius]
MVYVFFVQPGDMMTFDNEISIMQSVADLKEKIKQICGINLEQQVLLINGGEPLDSTKNLCSYMAGTDTNPIYLFSTNYDSSKIRILDNLNFDDSELKARLLECYDLPTSLATVKKRAQVANDFYNVAKRQLEFCEGFVHDQHMQQQGWSAVIANLEDIVLEFKKRWELYLKAYTDFIADRDTYNVFLQHFHKDKQVLQRIPVLETLLQTEKQSMEDSKASETNISTSQGTDSSKNLSLYDWISSSDSKSSLDEIYEMCKAHLFKFETEIMPTLEKQITETLNLAEKPERKEIEGLGKRLYDLEELLRRIKKYVEHQSDMAQSFQQNQNRASHLKDLSILPDLCATHLKQLDYIKDYHKKLIDERNRIVRAKCELSKSLCGRICWVQHVEERLWELDSLLVYYHEHLRRLRRHLEVFQQLHQAPTVYLNAVAEVVRRRNFSQLFLLWASDLACQQMTIHNEELTRRKEFAAQFEGHFLTALFPGMGDIPPSFATEAPSMFDAKLPKISDEDVERLRKEVPADLADNLLLPDISTVSNLYLGKSVTTKEKDKVDDAKAVEDKLIQAVSDVGLASNLDQNLLKTTGSETCLFTPHGVPHLKDIDKGCESETDTEEFEKVSQSPLELHFDKEAISQAAAPPSSDNKQLAKIVEKQDASTSVEDNLQISRTEHDKLKSLFVSMGFFGKQASDQLRTELNCIKSQILKERDALSRHCASIDSSWRNKLVEYTSEIEKLRNDYEQEVLSLKKLNEEKENKIKTLMVELSQLEATISEYQKDKSTLEENLARQVEFHNLKVDELMKLLDGKDLEKEKCMKELADTLKLEHKAEIENIKSRFRLMTMERSPSCSSLEKERSGDFASLSNPTLLAQLTENFEADKEVAVAQEREKWKQVLEERVREVENKFEDERDLMMQEVARRVAEDKDRQIDMLREREKNLVLECIKHKTTIQQLAENESEHQSAEFMEQIEILRTENEELQKELEKIKCERAIDVTTSVAVVEAKIDAATSPLKESQDLSRSEIGNKRLWLNIDSCKIGDAVLIIWDFSHEIFKILQESKRMYFLHWDCLDKLGLSITDGKPNRTYVTGEVFYKEYCSARKSENRYKIPKGTKFFRVKVKPFADLESSQSLYQPKASSYHHSHGMTQSQSSVSAFEPLSEEQSISQSPPSTPRLAATLEEGFVEDPEEVQPHSVEKTFAEDSGIVDSVERATMAAEEDQIVSQTSGKDNRCLVSEEKLGEQRTYISSNWLEAMLRSMFSKSIADQ